MINMDDISLTKNQLIDLYYFATLGSTPNDQKEKY